MPNAARPRLSVEITPETHKRVQNLIPWGLQGPVMRVIIEDLLDLVEREGTVALALLIQGKVKGRQILYANLAKGGGPDANAG